MQGRPAQPNRLLGVTLITALLTAACSTGLGGERAGTPVSPSPSQADPSPWEKAAPSALGMDATKLAGIAAQADTGKSDCLAVARHGELAGEWYFGNASQNTAQPIWSATKSFTSVLVGIAQDDGVLSVDDPAAKWIDEWKGTPSDAVTIRDLLSNDSGREWSFQTDYRRLNRAQDRTEFAVGLKQQHKPGTVWAYNNAAVQTLQRVLREATGKDVARFAEERLFRPLGMTRTAMTADRAGNAQMFMGIRSTCRDMARLGQMMLDNGKWRGRQIVSAAYVKAATGQPSTSLNAAYGYLWWLNRPGVVRGPIAATDLGGAEEPATSRGRMVPGAPPQLYWALGLGNQLIQIDPASKTVVVRLGKTEPRPKPPTFGAAEAAKVVTEAVVQ
ncbi:serine hydrolase domain-containing protein [Actinomadura sp. HBU206391]|uniref:serine hydrolase domain-containing protein n=1 Tax=Actinomadura sp. HBU206391 TaxID=2731692 RepID=UPI00164EDE14|nr:serine hydrolase domain-containing protein [Actinomadura sp. HBU206391]MBC6461670.1 beta-lactamase family protein [Actinomadura sp. HBU206391]